MTIVVSDTNVFIALFRCDLLSKVFASSRIEVLIPQKIYEELTLTTHRTQREYPDLSIIINQCVHNANHGYGINLKVYNIQTDIHNTAAISAHFRLEEDAVIDKGEREAIPLAIEFSAIFISCDSQAVDEHVAIADKNNSNAQHFAEYCEFLKNNEIISSAEYDSILNILND